MKRQPWGETRWPAVNLKELLLTTLPTMATHSTADMFDDHGNTTDARK